MSSLADVPDRRTVFHLLVGATVGGLLSPLAGGGIAGFLDGPDLLWGLAVGVGVGVLSASVQVFVSPALGGFALGLFPLGELLWVGLAAYHLALGGLGGVVGAYAVRVHGSRS